MKKINNQYSRYIDCVIKNRFINIITSPVGTGKTTLINTIFSKYINIIWISPRKTYSNFLATKYGLESYQDIHENRIKLTEHPKLVI